MIGDATNVMQNEEKIMLRQLVYEGLYLIDYQKALS